MNCFLVLAFIAPLVLYRTTVDAHHHGDPNSRRGFNGHGSIGNAGVGAPPEHHPFKFFGVCSHSPRHRHPELPDFLKNVSSDGVKEFCNIVQNENLTKVESEQQLEQWAQNHGVQEQFKKFVDEKKQKLNNIQQKMQELIANITQFISEMEAIHGDTKLTKREEREKVFDLVNATERIVVALAKKIRAEAGFLSGEHGRKPCPKCGPQHSHVSHGHSSGPRVPRRAPRFPGGGNGPFGQGVRGPFGQNGNSQQDGPFWQNGSPAQGGPFGPNGNPPQGWPSGQNGNPPQGGPFGPNGNPPQGWPSGQNGNPPQGGPFGPSGNPPQGWPSGQNGNPPQGGPFGSNGNPPQGGPFGPNGNPPQGWPSGQNGNPPQGGPFGPNGNPPQGWPSGQNGTPSQGGPFGQNGLSGYQRSGSRVRRSAPQFSVDSSGRFGRGGNGPFEQSGNLSQGGPFGQNGTPPPGGPFGQNGTPPPSGPFGQNGTPPPGGPLGQNGTPPAGGPFGQNGTLPPDGPFGQNGTPPPGGPFGQNGTPPPGGSFGQSGNSGQ